jgi:hypothetical protein
MWLLVAVIMLTQMLMIVLSLVLPYPGGYDILLIVVSFFVCGTIIRYAWTWSAAGWRRAAAYPAEARTEGA